MDRFRLDLKIIRQVQRGEVSFIVKDPVALKYYRFGTLEVSLFKHLDGAHDHAQIAEALTAEVGLSLTGSNVASFVEELKKKDLIERSSTEKSLVLLERLRKQRKLTAETAAEGQDTLYMRFPFYDPDDFYNRVIKYVSFLWSRKLFVVYLILFSLAAIIIVSNWETVRTGLVNLYSFEDKGFRDIAMFVGVLFTVIVLHENGHGLTCKRYGGEVHEIGFMLIYFMPAFYANVTDTWTFESKAAKLWVTFAGAFVELIICSIATFVWFFSTPGYFTHDLAFIFMITAGLSSILINMNPLIRLDGYFALVDYLEIPKLGDDASAYLGLLVRRYIFRAPVEIPKYDRRLKRILFTYGVLSFLYRIFIITLTLLFFNRQLARLFPEMSVFIFPLLAYRLLRKKLKAMWKSIRNVYVDKKELLMKPKWLVTSLSVIAVVLGLFLFLPFSYAYHATFVLEPAEQVPVRAETEGFVGSVLVREGDSVRRGTLLAVMRDIDLEQERNSLRSQIGVLDRNALTQRALSDTARAIESEQQSARLKQLLAQTESELASLSIIAPTDGIIVTPRVENKAGMMLEKGAEFCQIARTGALRARVVVDDWDLKDVEVGAPAVLRLNATASAGLTGRVISLAPASRLHQRLSPLAPADNNEATNPGLSLAGFNGTMPRPLAAAKKKMSAREQAEAAADDATSPFEAPLVRFDALIALDKEMDGVKPGMSGDIKIYGRRRPLGVTVWQGFRDWFRSKVWW